MLEKAPLPLTELITTNANTIADNNGIAAINESYLLGEIIAEIRTTIAKTSSGILIGETTTRIFLSITDFNPQQIRRIQAAATTITCFGIIKKSVIPVKNTRGRRNIDAVATTVIIVLR